MKTSIRAGLAFGSFGVGVWVITNNTHVSSLGLFGNQRGSMVEDGFIIFDVLGHIFGASVIFGICFLCGLSVFWLTSQMRRFFRGKDG